MNIKICAEVWTPSRRKGGGEGMDVRIDETGTLIVEFDTGLRRRKRRKQMYMQLR